MLKLIRWIVGKALLAANALFKPRVEVTRTPEQKAAVDQELKKLAIYQFEACPFCIKVRRALKRLDLEIELKDVLRDERAAAELQVGGGQMQVPCLRIQEASGVRWMYESSDIIAYLEDRFNP